MRQLLKKNYIALMNMISDTHFSIDDYLSLTYDYKISRFAHKRLDYIMKKECEKVMKISYGLQMLPDTVLHIANSEEFHWLL